MIEYLKAFNLAWLFRSLGYNRTKYQNFSRGAITSLDIEEREALKAKIDEVAELAKKEIDGKKNEHGQTTDMEEKR